MAVLFTCCRIFPENCLFGEASHQNTATKLPPTNVYTPPKSFLAAKVNHRNAVKSHKAFHCCPSTFFVVVVIGDVLRLAEMQTEEHGEEGISDAVHAQMQAKWKELSKKRQAFFDACRGPCLLFFVFRGCALSFAA